MGEVILGMPGAWADNALEASDHYTTKVGGFPDWPYPKLFLTSHVLRCSSCGSGMCLIAQVYAPVSGVNLKINERVIYVFGCTGLLCRSWCAVRVQKSESNVDSESVQKQTASTDVPSETVPNTKWWDDACSFASGGVDDLTDDDDMDLEELGKALSQAGGVASGSSRQNLKKEVESSQKTRNQVPRPIEVEFSKNRVLPCFYIYTEQEKSSKNDTALCPIWSSLSIKDKGDADDGQSQQETWEPEGYEYDRALNADRTYLKFKKRIDAYPEQCLRYSLGGRPLLATGELGDPGACSLCGGPRHYEMQLMPPLLYFLQEAAVKWQKDLLDHWNWMTLIVYTCQKSCHTKTDEDGNDWIIAEEAVIAQYENPLNLNGTAQPGYYS
ncbi:Programmed cell death protein 2-like-like protein [Drosera capensis]